ncbi:hypothetical protein X777_01316 [Ooceraea biroi]|uniref:Uncharacterized protein n=1 Tax=Ooceraea biroi TaxID=2015173 RepID=A0A026WTC8_OOCBI|nr:hypothetical protein X777_01316 [Ooceraea biroi]
MLPLAQFARDVRVVRVAALSGAIHSLSLGVNVLPRSGVALQRRIRFALHAVRTSRESRNAERSRAQLAKCTRFCSQSAGARAAPVREPVSPVASQQAEQQVYASRDHVENLLKTKSRAERETRIRRADSIQHAFGTTGFETAATAAVT